jgi:hypothetical protein
MTQSIRSIRGSDSNIAALPAMMIRWSRQFRSLGPGRVPPLFSEALIMPVHLPKFKHDFDVLKVCVYPIQTRQARELAAEIRG